MYNINVLFTYNISYFSFQQMFTARLEAQKQRELALLALRRTVSRKSNSLEVHNHKTNQSFSTQSMLTYSISSINDNVSGQDSGFQINEIQGLTEDKRELKVENVKLQSELFDMRKIIQNLRATIEKKEEDLQASRNRSKMFEDHSSLLAIHAHELSERRQLLEHELEWREEQLNDMQVNNRKAMWIMKENNIREMTRNAIKMKEMEEATAALQKMNDQLKEELKERDFENQAKDIVSAVICNSLQETFNENIGQCLKNSTSLEEELSLLQTQVAHQESQLVESASLLQDSRVKCEMHEEKVSLLSLQLDQAETAMGILKSELVLKDEQIETMEMTRTEEIKRLADEANENLMKEVMKSESLEREIDRYRISQEELEEKVKEQQLLLASKQTTVDSSSITDKACRLDFEPMNSKCERIDGKDQHYTKGQERSKVNENALTEKDDKIGNLTDLKLKLKSSMDKCVELEEANKELEAKVKQLQLQLEAREEKIKELDEQLTIFDEELVSKDITIGKLMMKKAKRRGLRRFICCPF